MTDTVRAIAYLPSSGAPNLLAAARLAAVLAAGAGGSAVALLPAHIACEGIERSGVARVVRIAGLPETPTDGKALSEAFIAALKAEGIVSGEAAILLPYGTIEEDVAAGLSLALGGAVMGKCAGIALNGEGCRVERPAYGGRASVTLTATEGPYICLVRPGLEGHPPAADADTYTISVNVSDEGLPIERVVHEGPRQPPLETAKIVVSGGRGMGSAEGFQMLEQIAMQIGGVVGCSLPAADAGWYPVSRQIGQSGKFVNPDLYLAVGISAMTQHMGGIGQKVPIFAINNDPDSAMWGVAEVGVLADWRDILPPLLEALKVD